MYFASYDDAAHEFGVYSQEALHVLQEIDTMLGEMIDYVEELTGGNLVVCLVSDHGMVNNTFNIRPNVLFRENGLICANEDETIREWKVYSQRSGGTCEIRLHNREDRETREKVEQILYGLLESPDSGVAKVLTREEATKRQGFPECDYCTDQIYKYAQHGYDEEYEKKRAIYGIYGKGIEKNKKIGLAHIIDIAPTLAAIMGFQMPTAQGIDLLKKQEGQCIILARH